MKTLFLILLITLCNLVHAQDDNEFRDMRSWMLSDGDTTERYIFADTALIRSSPDTKQAPIDTLFAGDNITISGITHNGLTIRGIKGPWLKINYAKNGTPKNGYIWQGLVSCVPLRRGDIKFIYGIERRADSIYMSGKYKDTIKRYLVKLKVVQNGHTLAKASLVTYDDEGNQFSYSKVMSGMGLTNVQNMVVISYGGEACAIPLCESYFAFTKNNQLIRFPDKMNVGDADLYYHNETFTFPNEKNGHPDNVIWNMSSGEGTGKEDKKGNVIWKITDKKRAVYVWDGVNERITKAAGE
jgi:hypothetical protein